MSRRGLRSQAATENPDPAPVEPEPGFEDGEDEEGAAEAVAIAMLVCYSHSLLTLPPTFHFSHAFALIGSFWGPDFIWVIAL